MLPPIAPFFSPKAAVRARMTAERRAAAKARPDAALHAARNFIAAIPLDPGVAVALYHPIGDELDTGPLAAALAERGARLSLPCVERRGGPLVFRVFAPGDALRRGAHRTQEPLPDAAIAEPDIIVTPLLAFTRDGARLGYGGGYYDRTLAALREARPPIRAVGFAFGAQEVERLPHERHDARLDWIVTEREAIKA